MTDYSRCDTTALDSIYLLITELLPYLFERKQLENDEEQHVTFSINGLDMPPNLRSPWWQEDD